MDKYTSSNNMKKNILVFILLAFMMPVCESLADISDRQKDFINNLSDEQMYDLYIKQLSDAFTMQSSTDLPQDFEVKFNICFKEHVKKIFTANEIRELYIQSENFDAKSADIKIKRLIPKWTECIMDIVLPK